MSLFCGAGPGPCGRPARPYPCGPRCAALPLRRRRPPRTAFHIQHTRGVGELSHSAREWVWEKSTTRGTARLVLLALAERVGESCVAFGSTRALAARTNASERAVSDAIKATIRLGELELVEGRRGPYGARVYRLPDAVGWVPGAAVEGVQILQPRRTGVRKLHPRGRRFFRGGLQFLRGWGGRFCTPEPEEREWNGKEAEGRARARGLCRRGWRCCDLSAFRLDPGRRADRVGRCLRPPAAPRARRPRPRNREVARPPGDCAGPDRGPMAR